MRLLLKSLAFITLFSSLSAFDPGLLDLVDVKDNTYLVRGDLPEIRERFCYNTLLKNISKKLSHYQIDQKNGLQLIVVSLLSHEKEVKKIQIERSWLSHHPDQGEFFHYPIKGIEIDLSAMSKMRRKHFVDCRDYDHIQELNLKLSDLMSEKHDKPTVIYIHCNQGKDRTGEVCACYLMKFKGRSYSNVKAESRFIAKRSINHKCANVVKWYAFYLRDVEKVSSIGLIEGK